MANWYDQAQVIINGSGVLADSLTISSINNVEGVRALGRYGDIQQTSRGPLRNEIGFNYLLEPANEPNYQTINGLKDSLTSIDFSPLTIEVFGTTGRCYLNRYSIKTNINGPTKVSVAYSSFEEWSGQNAVITTGTLDTTKTSGVAHFWSTYLIPNNSTDTIFSEFEYNCNLDWKPIYSLGRKTPNQVHLGSISEDMSITRNIFKSITPSGQPSSEYYDRFTGFSLECLEAIYGTDTAKIQFNISGVPVVDSYASLGNQGYLSVKSRIQKFYN